MGTGVTVKIIELTRRVSAPTLYADQSTLVGLAVADIQKDKGVPKRRCVPGSRTVPWEPTIFPASKRGPLSPSSPERLHERASSGVPCGTANLRSRDHLSVNSETVLDSVAWSAIRRRDRRGSRRPGQAATQKLLWNIVEI
jgi:hypothetical protein